MRLIVDVKDKEAAFFLELISYFSFVQLKNVDKKKQKIIDGLLKDLRKAKSSKQKKRKLNAAHLPAKNMM